MEASRRVFAEIVTAEWVKVKGLGFRGGLRV